MCVSHDLTLIAKRNHTATQFRKKHSDGSVCVAVCSAQRNKGGRGENEEKTICAHFRIEKFRACVRVLCVCVLLLFFFSTCTTTKSYFAALSQISQPEFAIKKKTRTHSNHSAGRLTCKWGVCHNASHTRPSCCALRTAVTTT